MLLVQHLDAALGHDVERVARVALAEHRLARLDRALMQAVEQRLDILGREMAQQVALRQQGQGRAQLLALAIQRYSMKREG